jgi:CubicO group peptidase (beta-lactamase class C family)
MIERAAATTYRDYVAEHVFTPAGMSRSGFFRMDVVEPEVAEGVEAIESEDGGVAGWRRNIYSYPPIGGPDGVAHVRNPPPESTMIQPCRSKLRATCE